MAYKYLNHTTMYNSSRHSALCVRNESNILFLNARECYAKKNEIARLIVYSVQYRMFMDGALNDTCYQQNFPVSIPTNVLKLFAVAYFVM